MPRALRIICWTTGILVLLATLGIGWVNSELKPEPLGRRVANILQEAKVKGGIKRVEASLDGNFSAEGLDLTLSDGTNIKAASIKGQLDLFASACGTPTLNRLTATDLNIVTPKIKNAQNLSPKKDSKRESSLPVFFIGPYRINGSITLADGKLINFNVEGACINSSGQVDLHGVVTWSGLTIGTIETKPHVDISIKGEFQRPLGQRGLDFAELIQDLKSIDIDVLARDEKPSGAGSMKLTCQGKRNSTGRFVLNGALSDASNQPAIGLTLTENNAELISEINIALDPAKFGVLSDMMPDCSTNGKIRITANTHNTENWQAKADLQVKWDNLTHYSKAMRPGLSSSWNIKSFAQNSAQGLSLNELIVSGNGITLKLNKPLHWQQSKGIEEVSLTLNASENELATLAPLLASTHLIPIQGRWSGEAELAFRLGDINIKTLRTHSITGLTLERDGTIIAQNLNGEIPLRTDNGALIISPFRIYSTNGDLVRGDVTLKVEKNSDWSLKGKLNLGLAEIANQTGQGGLPIEKLRNTRIDAQVDLNSKQTSLSLNQLEAKILRSDLELFNVTLLQPFKLNETKPAGVLFEAKAAQLPLEAFAALVPGLNLTGSLNQAKLVGGFEADGLFLRTQNIPIEFSDVSLSWNKTPYFSHCNLSTQLDLIIGGQKNLVKLTETSVQSRGKTLAEGNLSIGLNELNATMELRGDISAIAQQPVAQVMSNITNGTYTAQLKLNARGEGAANIKLSEISFKNRPAKIKTVNIDGTLSKLREGFQAEAQCKIESTGTTSGKLSVHRKAVTTNSHWEIEANFESISGDDLMAFFSQPENASATPTIINPTADRLPFWNGHTGNIKLGVQSAHFQGLAAEKLLVQLTLTDEKIALTQLSGKFSEGTLTGAGNCTFNSGNASGPYQLSTQVKLEQFNFAPLTLATPVIKDFVQGKGDAFAMANGTGMNLDDLIAKVNLDANLKSKNGRMQLFGGKDSTTATSASKAGQTAKLLGGIAKLAGALSKNKNQADQINRAGDAMSAASKLQESLSDFKYDIIDVQIQRFANGSVKIKQGLIQNPELTIKALGQITAQPNLPFNDWPLVLEADMRGKGTFGEQFKLLGFAEAIASADGLTQGPKIQFTGSLNHLQNDLKDRLQGAVKNIPSGGNSRQPTPAESKASAPANTAPPAINPVELLLRN